MLAADNERPVGNRRRGHDEIVECVGRQQFEFRTGFHHTDFALFRSEIESVIAGDGRRRVTRAAHPLLVHFLARRGVVATGINLFPRSQLYFDAEDI